MSYMDRFCAALTTVVMTGPPIPRRNLSRPKTTVNYTDSELKSILGRVLDGVKERGNIPLILLKIMSASKQVDDTQAVWFDVCCTVYDVSDMIALELQVSVVVPYGGEMYVTRCEPSSRNSDSEWVAPANHDPYMLMPFREVGT